MKASKMFMAENVRQAEKLGLKADLMSVPGRRQKGQTEMNEIGGEIYLWSSLDARRKGKKHYIIGVEVSLGSTGREKMGEIWRALQRYNRKVVVPWQIAYGLWYIHVYHNETGDDKRQKLAEWRGDARTIEFESEDDLFEKMMALTEKQKRR